MHKLIKLELKRNKLTTYYIALTVISIAMTGFLYMIATIAKVENDVEFRDYKNILKLHTGIAFLVFSIFSVVMYSKFIIEDYSPKMALLMFSYPISRTKIFIAKMVLVTGFIALGFLSSTLIPDTLFFLTESTFPILGRNITIGIVSSQIINIVTFILALSSIGFISLRIGFINKSVSTTIVTAIILSAILGNVLMGLGTNSFVFIGVVGLFIIGLAFAYSTNKQINDMEI
ncbi:hypothetical protein JK636_17795 [Clostridium sp. YIM B02515]|uniref:ABC-2 family transporter protein n=1 Tax=Clostridium rhizosphaerae TaxID=2803861 RepID=A0ABS1TER6_9CLOT|nr:hypothetical protein [Clostridium rhizosphaerae]MBL4937572.1 hypothetical protein [Clostridium rhizosphaerae]